MKVNLHYREQYHFKYRWLRNNCHSKYTWKLNGPLKKKKKGLINLEEHQICKTLWQSSPFKSIVLAKTLVRNSNKLSQEVFPKLKKDWQKIKRKKKKKYKRIHSFKETTQRQRAGFIFRRLKNYVEKKKVLNFFLMENILGKQRKKLWRNHGGDFKYQLRLSYGKSIKQNYFFDFVFYKRLDFLLFAILGSNIQSNLNLVNKGAVKINGRLPEALKVRIKDVINIEEFLYPKLKKILQFCKNWRLTHNRSWVIDYRLLHFVLLQPISIKSLNHVVLPTKVTVKRSDFWQTQTSLLQRSLLRKQTIRNLFSSIK